MDDAIPGLRQIQAPQVCGTDGPGPGPPPAPATPAPLGLSSHPPDQSHPTCVSPFQGRGAFAALWSSKADFRFPTKALHPRPGLRAGFHGIPGSAGGTQDAGSPELPAEPEAGPGRPTVGWRHETGDGGELDTSERLHGARSCTDTSVVTPQSPLTGREGRAPQQAGTWWPSRDNWAPQTERGDTQGLCPPRRIPQPSQG